MRKYDLVILDFDGTLADTYAWFESALNEAAARFSFRPVDPADRAVLRASGPRQLLAYLGIPWWKVPLVSSHMQKRMANDLHRLSLFEGIPGMLAAISAAGARSVIVSSNAESNVRALLAPEAAVHIADYECGASMFGKASRVKKVLARMKVAPSRALLIGDEIRDAEAAHASSVAFGAVAWGYNTREALRGQDPAHAFETVEDIVRLFRETA
ncbi:MAG TPA: HAD hydrolase-like protein [Polyangiaceae bacterium]|jgi:phosphoglycolate phosphatase|nr:HAD hydrolase-like protein [Polyangiaceae bacterium]